MLAVLVVGLGTFAGLKYHADHSNKEQIAAVTPPRPGCDTVTVAAATEMAPLLTKIADTYNHSARTVNGKCFGIKIDAVDSADAEAQLVAGWDVRRGDAPDVWAPASSSWLAIFGDDAAEADRSTALVPSSASSIASTALTIAMPKPMATALGWPKAPIGWSELAALAGNPAGWGSKGHPEWGAFTFVKANPNYSTSGLNATIAAFNAGAGSPTPLSSGSVASITARRLDASLEQAVVNYGDDPTAFLRTQQRADTEGKPLSYASAYAVDEKAVLDYDAGNPSGDPKTAGTHAKPRVPLVAIYPTEGTLFSDNPYAVLNAPWSTRDREAGAKDFFDYVVLPAQQKVLTDAGFRGPTKKPGAGIVASPNVSAAGPTVTLSTPSGSTIAALRSAWGLLRKPARVLLMMDVSSSMGDSTAENGPTKLEQAKSAALSALDEFNGADEVGLWQYSSALPPGAQTYQELVPVGHFDIDKSQITAAISTLTPKNDSTLIPAVRAATSQLTEDVEPGHINAVVLLNNAKNNFAADNDQAGLVAALQRSTSGVQIYSIAYGSGADKPALQSYSDVTKGQLYDATDTSTAAEAFTSAFASF
ncbi:substrate-binding domain-containing protein [Jatrophihabitans sp. GAS493]|uniref:substrate-binding domain-containing protein n=1 Tax=Jatrophihabitans sp. GAS493 TaxID=1907575 RepID=UPI0012FDEEA6|nr:substrate-binding domain-containing protein [Jatrophihabitans sp. GAS493]